MRIIRERVGITIDKFNRAAAILAGFGLAAMMVLGTADVVGTNLLGTPVPGTYELTKTIMVGTVFLSLALAQFQKRHIRVNAIVGSLPGTAKRVCNTIAHACSCLFYLSIAAFGWEAFFQSIESGAIYQGLIGLPLWPARLALALGASLITIQAARDALRFTTSSCGN